MSTTELSKKTKRSLHQEKEVYLRKEDRNFLSYFSEQTVQMIIINLFDINLEITYIVNNFKKELNPWILGLTISTTENLDYLTLLCTYSLMQSIYTFL